MNTCMQRGGIIVWVISKFCQFVQLAMSCFFQTPCVMLLTLNCMYRYGQNFTCLYFIAFAQKLHTKFIHRSHGVCKNGTKFSPLGTACTQYFARKKYEAVSLISRNLIRLQIRQQMNTTYSYKMVKTQWKLKKYSYSKADLLALVLKNFLRR